MPPEDIRRLRARARYRRRQRAEDPDGVPAVPGLQPGGLVLGILMPPACLQHQPSPGRVPRRGDRIRGQD